MLAGVSGYTLCINNHVNVAIMYRGPIVYVVQINKNPDSDTFTRRSTFRRDLLPLCGYGPGLYKAWKTSFRAMSIMLIIGACVVYHEDALRIDNKCFLADNTSFSRG